MGGWTVTSWRGPLPRLPTGARRQAVAVEHPGLAGTEGVGTRVVASRALSAVAARAAATAAATAVVVALIASTRFMLRRPQDAVGDGGAARPWAPPTWTRMWSWLRL